LNYIAPEAISTLVPCDIRSDLYSLGVSLFEMLAGALPFEAEELPDLARHHRQSRPPDLTARNPGVPPAVARLVEELLAKQPLRRPRNPAELVERLVRLEIRSFGARQSIQPPPSTRWPSYRTTA
jgi:serine/threonine-protein kinase